MLIISEYYRFGYRYGVRGWHPYQIAACHDCNWTITAGVIGLGMDCPYCG